MCNKVDRSSNPSPQDLASREAGSGIQSAQNAQGTGKCKKKKKCASKEDMAQLKQELAGVRQELAQLKQMMQQQMSQCQSPQQVQDSRSALAQSMGGQLPPQFMNMLDGLAAQRMGQLGYPGAQFPNPGSVGGNLNIFNVANTTLNLFGGLGGARTPAAQPGPTIASLPAPVAAPRTVPSVQSPFTFA
jgi:hypothetical protein